MASARVVGPGLDTGDDDVSLVAALQHRAIFEFDSSKEQLAHGPNNVPPNGYSAAAALTC